MSPGTNKEPKRERPRTEVVRRLEHSVAKKRATNALLSLARFGFYPLAFAASAFGLLIALAIVFAIGIAATSNTLSSSMTVLLYVLGTVLPIGSAGLAWYGTMRLKDKVDAIAATREVDRLMTKVRIEEVQEQVEASPAGGAQHGLSVSDEANIDREGELSLAATQEGEMSYSE